MEKLSMGNVSANLWQHLKVSHRFDLVSLSETLLGGQAFRWAFHPDSRCWSGIVKNHVLIFHLSKENELFAVSPTRFPTNGFIEYLGLKDLPVHIDKLPWRSDPVLLLLKNKWQGVSILHQPAEETLLGFLLSSNKQILQIRAMLETLASRFGIALEGTNLHALPTWKTLAEISEEDLRACSLGYRARHVAKTAAFLRDNPSFLEDIKHKPYEDAKESLMQLQGVGAKVADCVLLFGYGRMDAFPVDTWIERILVEKYNLLKWTRPQLAQFARLHFGDGAGLAQQWFFADAREAKALALLARASQPTPPFVPDRP
jgi:N-glycosylase/DNA lyase